MAYGLWPMAYGLNFGIRRTVPHLLGVSIGFAVMVFAVGLGIAGLFKAFPALHLTLKGVIIVYRVLLAWRIAMAGEVHAGGGAWWPFAFLEAAAFQWGNPKVWIMAVGISATYLVAGQFWTSLVVVTGVFLVAGLCSPSTWAIGGTGLRCSDGWSETRSGCGSSMSFWRFCSSRLSGRSRVI